MKPKIVAVLAFVSGVGIGLGISTVSAQDSEVESNWQIGHGSTATGMTSFYIVKYDQTTGEVWLSKEGKDFELVKEKK